MNKHLIQAKINIIINPGKMKVSNKTNKIPFKWLIIYKLSNSSLVNQIIKTLKMQVAQNC